jgi:transglutaminase-like putative cysteine protease
VPDDLTRRGAADRRDESMQDHEVRDIAQQLNVTTDRVRDVDAEGPTAELARATKGASAQVSPRSRRFYIDCKLSYTLASTTDFVFQIHALQGLDQEVMTESLRITPGSSHRTYEDPHIGHRFLRVHAAPGALNLRYRARVRVSRPRRNLHAHELPIAALPDDLLHNLMPTRYCESDLLGPAAIKLFGGLAPGYSRVAAICDWIQRNLDYRTGSSDTTTTACDVFLRRAGVCRDFAHLGVTFCRALNIPARLAVGYAIFGTPPPDFHAMFEAFDGGRWELFDATRMSDPRDLVRIAVGRDAKDVAFATIFGTAQSRLLAPIVKRVELV